jgi:HEPN domain-containing protein
LKKTKAEHIAYWVSQANDDAEASELLFSGKKFLHALFFTHLSIEKIRKACWINDNSENIPPRTHNLIFIVSQTKMHLTQRQNEFLLELNRFQIEGRYPEQIDALHKIVNSKMTRSIMDEAKQLQQWLLSKLP